MNHRSNAGTIRGHGGLFATPWHQGPVAQLVELGPRHGVFDAERFQDHAVTRPGYGFLQRL